MTEETIDQKVARLVQEELDKRSGKAKRPEPVHIDVHLKRALSLNKREDGYDLDAAAKLFVIWTEQHSEVRDSLQPLIREALERRLADLAESPITPAA